MVWHNSLQVLALSIALFGRAIAADIDTEGLPDTGLNTSTWVTGQLPPLDDIFDLNDMQIAAKNVLSGKFYGILFPHFRRLSLNLHV